MPGSAAFQESVWRRRPALYRGFFSSSAARPFSFARFRRWCDSALPARVYVRTEERAPGSSEARRLRRAADGLALYERYAADEALTLLLNGVDSLDESVRMLHRRFRVPYAWRRGDTVATLSSAGAGIGFHAGREDGFIVQMRGRRRWTVWSPKALPAAYARSLIGGPGQRVPEPARARCRPVLSCVLMPGDVLYVPPLFAHEGVTLEESLSIALAWQGLSGWDVLVALAGSRTSARVAQAAKARLFRLLPDPPPAADPASFLAEHIACLFDRVDRRIAPRRAEIESFVGVLLHRGLRPA